LRYYYYYHNYDYPIIFFSSFCFLQKLREIDDVVLFEKKKS
jgi:hypothetical protein